MHPKLYLPHLIFWWSEELDLKFEFAEKPHLRVCGSQSGDYEKSNASDRTDCKYHVSSGQTESAIARGSSDNVQHPNLQHCTFNQRH